MKRSLILLTGLFFLSSSAWSAGTLKVTTPNGGQKWTTGTSYAVKWSKGNAGAKVKIQLLKNGRAYKWISKSTANDGNHTWKIPSTVATGSAYKIKITSTTKKTVTDTSNSTFSITKASSGGTLAVTTPNGGQKWTTGTSYAVKWSKGNAGAKVKIQLLKNGRAYKWISKSTANDGNHTWKIPSTVATGSAYKIKITSTTKKTVTDSSNKNFNITKAASGGTLAVTTPNGGQKWTTGKTYQIKWSKGTAGAKVKIQLLKNGRAYKWISKSTANDGNHTWKIPSTVATGSAYKIKITSTTKKTVTDTSNSTFTITAKTTSKPKASLSCSPSSASEKRGKFTCKLKLSAKSSSNVTAKVAYSGTATAKTDYSGNKTTHTIKSGKTSTAWKLTGKADTKTEGKETIVVDLDSVTNATIKGTQRETLTLTDVASQNPTVSLSCSPSSASEKAGKFTCNLALSSSTTKDVTAKVSYSGTATAKTDYSGNKTTHTIKAGKTSTAWRLTGKADTKTEGKETIVVDLDSVTNATEKGTQKETLTLTDVATAKPTVTLTCTPSSASEDGGKFTCGLILSKKTTKDVTTKVTYSGTAKAGTDYSGHKATHVIKAGSYFEENWILTGKSDATTEGNESIVINVTSVTNGTEKGTQKATLTLTDKVAAKPTVTLACSPASFKEDGGASTCRLTLSKSTTKNVRVEVAYSGSATAGTDYSGNTVTHVIPKGSGVYKWTLTGKADTKKEGNESIVIDIVAVTNATEKGTQQKTLTLTNVTVTKPTITLACSPASFKENGGTSTCKLTLSKSTTKKVSVKVAYSGTAKAITDYSISRLRDHVITAGDTSSSWTLTGKADTKKEGNETIVVDLDSVTNATEKGTQKETLTLTDVVVPGIKITSPNGGENWEMGSKYPIRWDKGTGISHVAIYLYKSGAAYETIVSKTTNNGGGTWTIPNLTESSEYKIKICDYAKPSRCDESDNNFTIVDPLPGGDYSYLCYHNDCSSLGGITSRWASKTINVLGSGGVEAAFDRWPSVSFNHGASGGITIGWSNALPSGICGSAAPERWTDGTIRGCDIRINNLHADIGCGTLDSTITHEAGHCIGFFEHTSDGGLMDATAGGTTAITSPVRSMIGLLYSMPPGTDASYKLSSSAAKKASRTKQFDSGRTKTLSEKSAPPRKLPTKYYYLYAKDK